MDTWHQPLVDFSIIAILLLGIRQFRTPRGARVGNGIAAFAFACALAAVLCRHAVLAPLTVTTALVLGGLVGWLAAMRVTMIQIPAMIAFQHGAGGTAAFVVSLVELTRDAAGLAAIERFSGVLGIIIGAATFSASMVASAKLASLLRQTPTILPKHGAILAGFGVAVLVFSVATAELAGPARHGAAFALIVLSSLLGIVFAIRVGGADMPVLISFLNATAGLAAAFCGIVTQSRLLVACGATVAASGLILTHVMCQAMNRNLFKVFVASEIKAQPAFPLPSQNEPRHDPSLLTPERRGAGHDGEIARAVGALRSADKIIIIPGYGMALAQAQFEVVRLANRLAALGKQVKFAIHPIAGRMPGHMHVLLAEAEVDSDMLFDMPEVNPEFSHTDLAVIVGACDIVNPAAIDVPGTPISGMPILAAHEAQAVLICNLDAQPGYSGVANPLYQDARSILVFGDAKTALTRLLETLA